MVEGGGQLPQPDVWGSVVGLLELDVGGSDVELLELVMRGGDVELLQLELGGGGMAQLLQQGLGVVGQEQQLCVEGSGQLSVEESGGQLPQLGWLFRQNIIMLRVTTSDHLPTEGVC